MHPRLMAISALVFFTVSSLPAQPGRLDPRFLAMFGARYDNMRMCVATPAGVKGGPIADVMVTLRYGMTDRVRLGMDLPVMRPILFGLAFSMLQFEPQLVIDWKIPGETVDFTVAPTLGASLHYGPDYASDSRNRSPSFFAAGPILGLRAGVGFRNSEGKSINTLALRPFFASLLSADRGTGTVAGVTMEYLRSF